MRQFYRYLEQYPIFLWISSSPWRWMAFCAPLGFCIGVLCGLLISTGGILTVLGFVVFALWLWFLFAYAQENWNGFSDETKKPVS